MCLKGSRNCPIWAVGLAGMWYLYGDDLARLGPQEGVGRLISCPHLFEDVVFTLPRLRGGRIAPTPQFLVRPNCTCLQLASYREGLKPIEVNEAVGTTNNCQVSAVERVDQEELVIGTLTERFMWTSGQTDCIRHEKVVLFGILAALSVADRVAAPGRGPSQLDNGPRPVALVEQQPLPHPQPPLQPRSLGRIFAYSLLSRPDMQAACTPERRHSSVLETLLRVQLCT
ncbi:unnamed protein product [Protopolystoma xenopodis]|uniref:Uncharacterized protein n=1 Tax=Protopolystoma xenopodis TaxID=117903 RepID=A0A448WZB8_9PLAT|nr:unnamed protein product [Protopolystoma xenopodis]